MSDHLTPARRRLASLAICLLAVSAGAMAFGSGPASAAVEGYRNSTAISLPGNGNASSYPSTINVPPMEGVVTGVTVTFHGFSHGSPQSVNALLVAPDGKTSLVMALSCTYGVASTLLIFSDSGPAAMPSYGPCDKIVYRPTKNSPDGWVDFGDAVPDGPYSANFNNFLGSSPAGAWKLYIKGYGGARSGKIAGGWSLTLETRNPDAVIPRPGPSQGEASPYPLSRVVSGVDGLVTDLNVSVPGVYHQNAADLEMMLVGPRGQFAVLLSDSCPGDVRYETLKFDDEGGFFPPVERSCASGVYKPVGRSDTPAFPGLGFVVAGTQTALSGFDLTDPNGTWKLYVFDDHPSNAFAGLFLERFNLELQTRPRAALEFGSGALEIDEGGSRELTVTRSADGTQTAAASVQLVTTPRTAGGGDFEQETLSVEFAPGETEKTVTLRALADAVSDPGETFDVKIGSVSGDARPTGTTAATVTIRDVPPARGGGNPGDAAGDPTGGQPEPDRTAPQISGVALAPKRFAVSRRRTPTAARTRRGTTIRYTLSEAGAVTLRFQRAVAGRRSAGRCLPRSKVRRGRPCRRWVAAGVLRRRAVAGANRVRFSGRIGRRPLRPGAHRLLVRATDAAGNAAAAGPRAFRVVR